VGGGKEEIEIDGDIEINDDFNESEEDSDDEGDDDGDTSSDDAGQDGDDDVGTGRRRTANRTKVQRAPFYFEADKTERLKDAYTKRCDEIV